MSENQREIEFTLHSQDPSKKLLKVKLRVQLLIHLTMYVTSLTLYFLLFLDLKVPKLKEKQGQLLCRLGWKHHPRFVLQLWESCFRSQSWSSEQGNVLTTYHSFRTGLSNITISSLGNCLTNLLMIRLISSDNWSCQLLLKD